ncbi:MULTISPECIES: MaoC/PaaZ C-terminal domain-containing protein [unclassified Paracoccus (in: a-proteobacteria)]|uniref:MaoC/PaaZ C-terminal domain-containing protein n=1 Tax=unclassified Paracoccus (in: a-proteobacteria) TaxID=2688777 RepID=UPI0015FFEA24|nr:MULTISPECIES: MaoC/PaaZ C-terminal domain-containing protein [unclassified Paracoccus (in: a-proteobacteria)]MBB1492849.1 MaoC family dehydratase N-terminal domain-containing protein [Paracoccus sp. MC1854]MBB1499498.1 MaoC family dehydratase N-terminal domain-containing protein [Paracoccus sp. MC1862]QQO45810.1 MaoC family dehydratase N-terminal domain-containing protein [Paracoccus sp. MC1862]
MPIDPENLLNFDIPEVVQEYGPREAAFYALTLGLGNDPMNRAALRFAGGLPRIEPFPTMPLVLAHPGFWLKDPRTGVDALRVVHGEQGMTLHAPLPDRGRVTGKTRVTDLIDKGEGKGALLYTEKELRDAETGMLLATTRNTTFLRGDGGFGGPTGPVKPVHKLPETEPDGSVEVQTRPEQALYYRWNGDDNVLHLDPEVAARAGFERPILHGMCSLGVTANALLAGLCGHDASRFRGLDARFTASVYPGETLCVEFWKDGSFRTRVVERDVIAIGNGKFDFAWTGGKG